MDRLYLLAPALLLAAFFIGGFVDLSRPCTPSGRATAAPQRQAQPVLRPVHRRLPRLDARPGRAPARRPRLAELDHRGLAAAVRRLPASPPRLGHLAFAVWLYVFGGHPRRRSMVASRGSTASRRRRARCSTRCRDRWGELFVFTGYAWYLHDSPWMLAVSPRSAPRDGELHARPRRGPRHQLSGRHDAAGRAHRAGRRSAP